MKANSYRNGSGGSYTVEPLTSLTQDPKDATTWTTDEKILLAKFNIVGIDLLSMLGKYFGFTGYHPDMRHYNVQVNGKWYGPVTLNTLKSTIFPDLKTNVTDALTKILTGEGIIAKPTPKVIDIIQPVVTNPPVVPPLVVEPTVPVTTTPTTPSVKTGSTVPSNTNTTPTTPSVKTGSTVASNTNTTPTTPSVKTGSTVASNTNTTPVVTTPVVTTPTVAASKDYKLYYIGAGILVVAIVGVVIILKK